MPLRRTLAVSTTALIALTTAACGSGGETEVPADEAVLIYSGRNENLVERVAEGVLT